MHVFPVLRKLERKWANELVVIGVHSAKFTTEKQTENLREAVLRNEIDHPVVNDRDFVVWQHYAVRAWPTLYFIDPRGKVIGRHEGEISFEVADDLVARIVAEFDARGQINRQPVRFAPARTRQTPLLLSYPGKVLADPAQDRLFVADTNHNRIVVVGTSGAVRDIIGSGAAGLADGDFATARFNHPQGLALDRDELYVADTENHAIRRIDLSARTITTLAGRGEQARRYHRGGKGRDVDLNSPWDVAIAGDTLYVAMAGFHQVWALDLHSLTIRPFAGTGHEGLRDGMASEAWLAQPSGLTVGNSHLYVADSESSAIREIDLEPPHQLRTLIGEDLFDFGDVDGVGSRARLQHPLGVTWYEGAVYLVDTYNHKLKRLDPTTREVRTIAGTGQPGHADGPVTLATFHEPGGLSAAEGKLYVADTDNHEIRVVDLDKGETSTLQLRQ